MIGKGDLIFVPACQRKAWSELRVPVEEEDMAHYSDVFYKISCVDNAAFR